MLSPHARELKRDLDLKEASVEKLVPNLKDKKNYILHYQNLKLYLELGMELSKVHRVLASWGGGRGYFLIYAICRYVPPDRVGFSEVLSP